MKITIPELRDKIAAICTKYENPRAKRNALKALQWVLVVNGWPVSDDSGALIFDGRDNEEMKVNFYAAIYKLPVEIHLVNRGNPCLCGAH